MASWKAYFLCSRFSWQYTVVQTTKIFVFTYYYHKHFSLIYKLRSITRKEPMNVSRIVSSTESSPLEIQIAFPLQMSIQLRAENRGLPTRCRRMKNNFWNSLRAEGITRHDIRYNNVFYPLPDMLLSAQKNREL